MPQARFEEGEFTGFRRSEIGFNPRSLSDIIYQKKPPLMTDLTDKQKLAVFDLLMRYYVEPSMYETRDTTKTLHSAFVKHGERRKDGKALSDALLEGLRRHQEIAHDALHFDMVFDLDNLKKMRWGPDWQSVHDAFVWRIPEFVRHDENLQKAYAIFRDMLAKSLVIAINKTAERRGWSKQVTTQLVDAEEEVEDLKLDKEHLQDEVNELKRQIARMTSDMNRLRRDNQLLLLGTSSLASPSDVSSVSSVSTSSTWTGPRSPAVYSSTSTQRLQTARDLEIQTRRIEGVRISPEEHPDTSPPTPTTDLAHRRWTPSSATQGAGPSSSSRREQAPTYTSRASQSSKLSAAQQEAQTKARLETQDAYHDAIEDLFKQQEDVTRELALKFNKSLSTVLQDVQHRGKLTHRRGVNPYNAWNHFKKMDLLVDELDITEDEINLLLELQDVEDEGYEKFKLLPEKLHDLVIDELVLYREHQMKGSRMTARARGQDIRFSSERIVAELEALNARCSTTSFLFIVRTDRSHVHAPFHWAPPKAQAYIETVLKRDVHDLAFEFEAFTLSGIREVAKNANARRVQLKSKIREAIRLGLEEITGIQGMNMEWTRYEARIVDVHKVAITGWPKKIPFTCELATTSLDVVLAAILEGTCK
ncbi:hypothetical protein ACEPAG_7559 [Sanghuangporus baumii]